MIVTRLLDASDASIALAVEALARGELCAFPTETVYGLGARADDEAAVRRIFEAKGRPESKPLIVHVRDVAAARVFVAEWPERAERLAEAFWPIGGVTLVLPKAPGVCDAVTAGGPTVAVRAPAHPVAQRLLAACGFSIAAPSANRSGEPPPMNAADVVAQLEGRIPWVLDGGTVGGTPSTLVDLSVAPARILRHGAVAAQAIAEIVPVA